METGILNKLSGILIAIAVCSPFTSCSHDNTVSGGGTSNDAVLKNAVTEWGMTRDGIISHMSGYNMVQQADNSILQFTAPGGRQSISYKLNGDRLVATAVTMPRTSSGIDFQASFGGYTFTGELGGCEVYENLPENTMAAVWQARENDAESCAIGFAPISSDAFDEIVPVQVTTNDLIAELPLAKASGSVSGTDHEVEAGIIYGTDSNLSEDNGRKASTVTGGDFSLTLNGFIDNTTYYYCAYAVVDGIYYLGEVKSCTTGPLTYTVDGKTFEMVHVEGDGSIDDFSIMQTELPPDSDFMIGSVTVSRLNARTDEGVTKTEFRNLLEAITEATGISFRLPTSEEWVYAAQGGNRSSGYTYSGSNDISEVAWYGSNSGGRIHEIATKAPNELGLYDMSGNYGEVCNDVDDEAYIDGAIRGGSWRDSSSECKCTSSESGRTSGNIPGTNIKEKNAFDARYNTVRLVYSRDWQ